MTSERAFNILETCCFPKGCFIDEETQPYLATVLIPKLEALGMTTAEWTRGALMLEEPHLAQVRSVVCRQCNHQECPYSSPSLKTTGLNDLKIGQWKDRLDKGKALLEQLLPDDRKASLKNMGIRVHVFQTPSRKNPHIYFTFHKDGQTTQRVFCEIGKKLLITNHGEEHLTGIHQVQQKIEEAIQVLS
jgi:hypothetical protein